MTAGGKGWGRGAGSGLTLAQECSSEVSQLVSPVHRWSSSKEFVTRALTGKKKLMLLTGFLLYLRISVNVRLTFNVQLNGSDLAHWQISVL